MKFIKSTAVFCLLFFLCAALFSGAPAKGETITLSLNYDGLYRLYIAEPIRLNVNGSFITDLVMPPVIIDEYALVPAREVFEPMNAVLDWDPRTSSVYIHHMNNRIVLTINDKYASVNGRMVEMPVPAKLINDKMMIPLRFVADSLNFLVYWDEKTRTAYIDDLNIVYTDPGYAAVSYDSTAGESRADTNGPASSILMHIQASDSEGPVPAKDVSLSVIVNENHPETSIVELDLPVHGNNSFTIHASSEISTVETHLLNDNRMYIDIHNAAMRLTTTSIPMADNPSVAAVRAAQNQMSPVKITRIVFDLKDGAEYSIALSADRKEIYVGFSKNIIQSVELRPDGAVDSVVITGQTTPSVSVYPSGSQDVLTIDMPYAAVAEPAERYVTDLRFIQSMRLEQINADMARITLTLKESVMYDIKTDVNTAVIRLSGRTYQNIEYDIGQHRLVIQKHPFYPISIHNFIHTDNYSSFKYTIHIGGDYSGYLGNGDHIIRDNYLNSVHLRTENGNTYLEFNETGIYAYNVYEDDENIYIQPVHPKEKYKYIVILDPGHGGSDNGTKGYDLIERIINLDISNRVLDLFEADDQIKAYAARTTDINPSLEERAEFGNNIGDLYISIHNNFAPLYQGSDQPKPEISGSETHYYPHEFDGSLFISCEQAARIMQRHIVYGFGSLDRGIKHTRYFVLDSARIPAVLLEIGFLSNEDDARKLASNEYRLKTAQSIYAGIKEIFASYTPRR